jgi:hypothetical protein
MKVSIQVWSGKHMKISPNRRKTPWCPACSSWRFPPIPRWWLWPHKKPEEFSTRNQILSPRKREVDLEQQDPFFQQARTHIWRFPEIGVPIKIIRFNRMFHYKPTILGYPHDYGNLHLTRLWKSWFTGAFENGDLKPPKNRDKLDFGPSKLVSIRMQQETSRTCWLHKHQQKQLG